MPWWFAKYTCREFGVRFEAKDAKFTKFDNKIPINPPLWWRVSTKRDNFFANLPNSVVHTRGIGLIYFFFLSGSNGVQTEPFKRFKCVCFVLLFKFIQCPHACIFQYPACLYF